MPNAPAPRRVTYVHPSLPGCGPMTGLVAVDEWGGCETFFPDPSTTLPSSPSTATSLRPDSSSREPPSLPPPDAASPSPLAPPLPGDGAFSAFVSPQTTAANRVETPLVITSPSPLSFFISPSPRGVTRLYSPLFPPPASSPSLSSQSNHRPFQ